MSTEPVGFLCRSCNLQVAPLDTPVGLTQRCKTAMVDLDAAFAAVNTSATGTITPAEVQAALALGGLTLSRPQARLLVKLYDTNKNGGVDRSEFGALHAFVDGVVTAVAAAPGQRVDAAGATTILRGKGITLDAPPLAAAFDAFDGDGDGSLVASELVGLACFLSAADAVFRAFAGAEGGDGAKIELTRDQFIYAAASCR